MKKEIVERLNELEAEKGITIPYACESGSRAWGFPSMDSDFDVRFIYMHKKEWYLSIDDKKDTIEDVGKILDFSGWELRKALRLFRASNASLYEKLQSPIVYKEVAGFREVLWKLSDQFYRPNAGLHHYLSLVHNFAAKELDQPEVKLKKYFYALRSILAAKWIRKRGGVPPMEFEHLRILIKDEKLNLLIDELLHMKLEANESLTIAKNELLDTFIANESRLGEEYVKTLKVKEKGGSGVLDEVFRNCLDHDFED
ncbi:MAG: nucleotidyltransferase domain-containing protein [Bacteroidota bacterium]